MILVSVSKRICDRLSRTLVYYIFLLTGLVNSLKSLQLEHILLYCISFLKMLCLPLVVLTVP